MSIGVFCMLKRLQTHQLVHSQQQEQLFLLERRGGDGEEEEEEEEEEEGARRLWDRLWLVEADAVRE